MLLAASMILLGLIALILRADIFVSGAASIAKNARVSPVIIGLSMVAVGTGLPGLAASVGSAMRGHTEIALGNCICSRLFNVLVVTAISGIVATSFLGTAILSSDNLSITLPTAFLAIALFISCMRSKSAPDHACLGRTPGTLLVSSPALYYYSLQSAL